MMMASESPSGARSTIRESRLAVNRSSVIGGRYGNSTQLTQQFASNLQSTHQIVMISRRRWTTWPDYPVRIATNNLVSSHLTWPGKHRTFTVRLA